MDTLIRPEFIVQYHARRTEEWAQRTALVVARDNKHQQLNRSYGITDPDGTVPIGERSHADIRYKQQYDRIQRDFSAQYESITPSKDAWMRKNGVSLYEYLLLDNCSGEEVDLLAGEARKQNGSFYDAIDYKAAAYIRRWKAGNTIDGLQSIIRQEINNHGYASARCKKFFSIKPWEISKHLAIINYSDSWKAALNKCFRNLKAG